MSTWKSIIYTIPIPYYRRRQNKLLIFTALTFLSVCVFFFGLSCIAFLFPLVSFGFFYVHFYLCYKYSKNWLCLFSYWYNNKDTANTHKSSFNNNRTSFSMCFFLFLTDSFYFWLYISILWLALSLSLLIFVGWINFTKHYPFVAFILSETDIESKWEKRWHADKKFCKKREIF